MATKIQALGDTIKIDTAFVSGKDRVAVNGQVVFEGKLGAETLQKFSAGNRDYALEVKTLNSMTGAIAVHLQIHEEAKLVHSGIYNQEGKPVQNEGQAKKTGAIQACGIVGGIIGFATMMFLNMATRGVPGGAIGGAIGGGVGCAIGYGLGTLIFGRK